jgi:Fe-S-cluster containining protein
MPERDSIDKVVQSYFSAITRSTFTYKGKNYEPKNLVVSPLLFRGYTCPEHCGGCCPRFSLDYIENEPPHPNNTVVSRKVILNNQEIEVWSDMQLDHENHHCRNLIKENGRCGIHGQQPFSCDFELIRFIHQPELDRVILTQKLFGRGWAMLRTDEERGARCEMTPITKETVMDVVRKLERLKNWAEYFKLDHCLDSVIRWAKSGAHHKELLIPKDKKTGFFIMPITSNLEEPLPALVQIDIK